MRHGVVSASRRRSARKHADYEHKCSCGRIVKGNGGWFRHKTFCHAYKAEIENLKAKANPPDREKTS